MSPLSPISAKHHVDDDFVISVTEALHNLFVGESLCSKSQNAPGFGNDGVRVPTPMEREIATTLVGHFIQPFITGNRLPDFHETLFVGSRNSTGGERK